MIVLILTAICLAVTIVIARVLHAAQIHRNRSPQKRPRFGHPVVPEKAQEETGHPYALQSAYAPDLMESGCPDLKSPRVWLAGFSQIPTMGVCEGRFPHAEGFLGGTFVLGDLNES